MRQKLIDTQILGRREYITLYAACDALLSISKESGAYETLLKATKRFKIYFFDIYLDKISNRDLCCWVEHERQRDIQDVTIRLWSMQFNKICRHAMRLGYYTPVYEWPEWHIKDKPIRYLTDDEELRVLCELDTLHVKDPMHRRSRQAITDVQHLLGHASVKTTERAYAAFVRNERFKQTIELLDQPSQPAPKCVT